MEIRNSQVVVTRPGRNYVIVKLETETGLVGWGDATLNGREQAMAATLKHHVFPEIEGMPAQRIEHVWQHLFRQTYWRGGPVLNTALAGIDMALWDIKGKATGAPVYDLLGGRTRDYARVYDHCGAESVDDIVENVQRAAQRGIDCFRINPPENTATQLDKRGIVDGARAIRSELGPAADMIVDVHGRARPNEAAFIASGLEEADLFFLEDPLRPENPNAFEWLRDQSRTPLAMGELFTTPWKFLPLIENQLIDYIRADLVHVGGITPARKLAAIGEHHYVRTAFHGPPDISPIGYAATVHVDLSVPNFGIQELTEHERAYGEPIREVFQGGHEFDPTTGSVDVPSAPGLGIDVDLSAAGTYEYERDHFGGGQRNPDGSVQDI